MIRNDPRGRLESMNERVGLIEPPVCVGLVPHTIEPDAAKWAVVGQQLGELAVHEVEIPRPLSAIRSSSRFARPSARPVISVMPVELRVVEEKFDSLPTAL